MLSHLLLPALVVLHSAAPPGVVEPRPLPEYLAKARIIRLLLDYVEWPTGDSGRPLIVAVLEPSPFGDFLRQELGKGTIKGRSVRMESFRSYSRIGACDVVFIPEEAEASLEGFLRALSGKPVLTIGGTSGFASRGVIVNLVPQDERTRLEINLTSLRASGLTISPHVLKGATVLQ